MPHGPSHRSHSGGHRSSHHSSHSSHSGGHSSGYRPYSHVHFFGRTVVVTSGQMSKIVAMVFALFVMFFFLLPFTISLKADHDDVKYYSEAIQIMEEDAEEYKDIIQKAQVDGYSDDKGSYYLIKSGNFKTHTRMKYYYESTEEDGIYYFDDYKGMSVYFIVYHYSHPTTSKSIRGETYAMFTSSNAGTWVSSGDICVYIDNAGNVYSINSNYTLENNYEYEIMKEYLADAQGSMNGSIIMTAIFGLVVAGLVVGLILTIVKSVKSSKENEEKEKAELAKNASGETKKDDDLAPQTKHFVCGYCGSFVPDDATRCPSCGSKKFKKYNGE